MIIFDLKCSSQGHVFEGWFGSSSDFEEQQGRGLINCPICGSPEVVKAVMAPAVGAKANRSTCVFSSGPGEVKRMLAALAAEQKKLLEKSEHVGERFADEARAIHFGEADARPIHGLASRAEANGLIEEGVPIAPLPFPVVPPGEEN
ncbi:DUF1178 family protein [Allosphingosinicella sp.]|jgi:hypothetical protein|uniref:DUF1178 family protein n=1 Tax=Allosphingosinicella sp. TaxID=2823234 RepID=UPI002EE30CE5